MNYYDTDTQEKRAYTDITTHMVKTPKRIVLTPHVMEIPEQEVGTMDMVGLITLTPHMMVIPEQKVGMVDMVGFPTLTQHMMVIPEQEVITVNLTMSSLTFHKVSISLCDHRHTYSLHGLKYWIDGCLYA